MKLMADVMRHFHARQHLGKAVVLTDDPAAMLLAGRKQWLKLSRTLQQRRAEATNAVEILKLTYTIAQMQQMQMIDKAPHEQPEANVFFVRPDDLRLVSSDCLSIYVTTTLSEDVLVQLSTQLPASSLIVDYCAQQGLAGLALKPKLELERAVADQWQQVKAFLVGRGIPVREFGEARIETEVLDDAVDALLEVEMDFLMLANRFQRALDLARPLKSIPKLERDQFETFLILAHRVQTFAPAGFSAKFLGTYADDTFFLNDNTGAHETLVETVARHERAGRFNLARALMRLKQPAGMPAGDASIQKAPMREALAV